MQEAIHCAHSSHHRTISRDNHRFECGAGSDPLHITFLGLITAARIQCHSRLKSWGAQEAIHCTQTSTSQLTCQQPSVLLSHHSMQEAIHCTQQSILTTGFSTRAPGAPHTGSPQIRSASRPESSMANWLFTIILVSMPASLVWPIIHTTLF
jgi:hypothetical protein